MTTSTLSKELHNIHNPALGAVILWRFISGFETGTGIRGGTPYPLLFIIIPMVFHPEILSIIKSTNKSSGLRAFVSKFSEKSNPQNDIIYSIQTRAFDMRVLSKDSIRLAIASNLILIDPNSGFVFPISITPISTNVPKETTLMMNQAEKLGFWCSQLTLHEISIILRMEF